MSAVKQALSIDTRAFIEKLDRLDLEPIAYKLMYPSEGEGWTDREICQAIARYKQFLFLIYLYPNRPLVPTQDIDRVWHHHILDTSKYARDCQMLFGRFIHHFPYFGQRGEVDRQSWNVALKQTQALFQEHFGMDAIATETPLDFTDCQPIGYAADFTRPRVNLGQQAESSDKRFG